MLVQPPDGRRLRLTGAAALAWMALDTPATISALIQRIEAAWPELGSVDHATAIQAMESLTSANLVDSPGPAGAP